MANYLYIKNMKIAIYGENSLDKSKYFYNNTFSDYVFDVLNIQKEEFINSLYSVFLEDYKKFNDFNYEEHILNKIKIIAPHLLKK
jgi:hypothetical protein